MEPALDEYIEEEAGHDEWILADIAACGGDAEAVRRGSPSPATELMVAYAYDTIERGNPIGFLGMVHVLEGTSVALALLAADRIQDNLRPPRQRVQLPALARHARPGTHQAPRPAARHARRCPRPCRGDARREDVLPALRRRVPRPAAAGRHGRRRTPQRRSQHEALRLLGRAHRSLRRHRCRDGPRAWSPRARACCSSRATATG